MSKEKCPFITPPCNLSKLWVPILVVRFDKTCFLVQIRIDALPSSLMDSTVSPKVKTTKGEKVGARSLAHNILRVEGHARALGWD
jgi:hypothetical protein